MLESEQFKSIVERLLIVPFFVVQGGQTTKPYFFKSKFILPILSGDVQDDPWLCQEKIYFQIFLSTNRRLIMMPIDVLDQI
jgi:hypothetical protein